MHQCKSDANDTNRNVIRKRTMFIIFGFPPKQCSVRCIFGVFDLRFPNLRVVNNNLQLIENVKYQPAERELLFESEITSSINRRNAITHGKRERKGEG